jgi:hypothetical protein
MICNKHRHISGSQDKTIYKSVGCLVIMRNHQMYDSK